MGLTHYARQMKHAAFVANKQARRTLSAKKWQTLTAVTPALSEIRPYRYDASGTPATTGARRGTS